MAGEDELLSAQDPHKATITARVIRSFEYRTIKTHVFRDIDLKKWTPDVLLSKVKALVAEGSGFRPYRSVEFDAAKIYSHAHLTKTQNLSINLDHDDWILTTPANRGKSLYDLGVMNETEISVYNEGAYNIYKENPVRRWE